MKLNKLKIYPFIFLTLLFTGCSFKKPEKIYIVKYKKEKIYIPNNIFDKDFVEIPSISEKLTIEDKKKINGYILKLYITKKTYEERFLLIKKIVKNFNQEK